MLPPRSLWLSYLESPWSPSWPPALPVMLFKHGSIRTPPAPSPHLKALEALKYKLDAGRRGKPTTQSSKTRTCPPESRLAVSFLVPHEPTTMICLRRAVPRLQALPRQVTAAASPPGFFFFLFLLLLLVGAVGNHWMEAGGSQGRACRRDSISGEPKREAGFHVPSL